MMRYFTVMVVATVVVWLATGTVLTLAGHGEAVPMLGGVLVDLVKALLAPLTAATS